MKKKSLITILFLGQSIISYADNNDESRSLLACKAGASLMSAATLGICTISGISMIPRINPLVMGTRLAAGTYGVYNQVQHGHAYWKHNDKADLTNAKSTIGSILQASACLINASTLLRIGLAFSILDVSRVDSFNLTKQTCYSVILPCLGMISLFGAYNELTDVYRILKK